MWKKPLSFHLQFSITIHTEYFTSDTSGYQMCGGFSPTPSSSPRHQLRVLQWSSILTLRRAKFSPTSLHLPHSHFRCQSQAGDPQPPWVQLICQSNSLNPNKYLCALINLLQDVIKNTDTQGEVWLLSHGVGVHHPLSTWMCSLTWKLSQLHASWIFMEASFSREVGNRADNSRLLIMWSLW